MPLPESACGSRLGTQPLTTSRLLLRRLHKRDAKSIYRVWASDPRVARYLLWRPHASVGVTRQWLSLWIEEYARPDCYRWGIQLQGQDGLIGMIEASVLQRETEQISLGYSLGYAYWQRGYATEALSAVVDYLFAAESFAEVVADHFWENPASGRVLRKAGLLYQGIRYHAQCDPAGRWHDVAFYALRQEQWRQLPYALQPRGSW